MKKIVLSIFLTLCALGFANSAAAATPTLSAAATGSGDNIQINVYGDANSSVLLFYSNTFAVLGTTNSSGSYSTTISSGTYNIAVNAQVYVRVGGISGQQSNTISWPWTQGSSTSGSTLTLSQSAILLNAGQTSTITSNANYLFLKNNTNPGIANININGSNIAVTANAYGSTVATICILGSTTNCQDLSVTVQNYGASQLGFSRNNFSVYSGQSASVTVTGGTGSYIISHNSNSTAIQAAISGSTITLTATSTAGAAAITICTTNMNYCGILNVNSTAVNSTAISFSQSNPFVPLNQNVTVTIFGGSGTSFYVSSNSNPSVVQPNISSNVLTLVPLAQGSSSISVCAVAGSCATLTATVANSGSSNDPISLSQTSIALMPGQQMTITIYGGSAPYYFYSSNSANVFNANVSGNSLTVYGVNQGSGSGQVCASVGCVNFSVSVNNSGTTSSTPVFSQNNISLNPGQQQMIYISGDGGSYYMANNSASLVATISITGTSVLVTGGAVGSTQIAICQNGGQCSTLYVTVVNSTQTQQPTQTQTYFSLTRYLGPGDQGDDVLQLQNALVKLGLLTATPNGYYGPATTAAVKAYQSQKGIRQTGNVGISTKASLESANIIISSTSTSITEIQAAIDALMAQIRAIRGY